MLGDQLWREPSGSHYINFLVREVENGVLEACNAKDLAHALHGLLKISRGEVDHMVVNGGSEYAFIVTLARWLLNLRVLVRNSAGQIILNDVKNEASRHVIMQYGEMSSETVQVAGTDYVLANCREVFSRIPEHEEYQLTVRTPWDRCLSRVFGSRFTALSNMPHILGGYLGGVARVYRALANGENDIGSLSRANYVHFVKISYGLGFVHTVISTFLELSHMDGLYDRMQHAVESPFDEAVRKVEQSILGLEALCSCGDYSSEQQEDTLHPQNSRMCLTGVAYATRRYDHVQCYSRS